MRMIGPLRHFLDSALATTASGDGRDDQEAGDQGLDVDVDKYPHRWHGLDGLGTIDSTIIYSDLGGTDTDDVSKLGVAFSERSGVGIDVGLEGAAETYRVGLLAFLEPDDARDLARSIERAAAIVEEERDP